MDSVFIVDEASMVGDKETKGDLVQFGSGRLLTDLINYARLDREDVARPTRGQIIFVGDPAQLPPVGETHSPAMCTDYLAQAHGLESQFFELCEVMRQKEGSAILARATGLRDAIDAQTYTAFDIAESGDEVRQHSVTESLDLLLAQLQRNKSCVFVTRTNGRARELNRAVRARLRGDEDAPLTKGDLLLINKNSYRCNLSNGDLARVEAVSPAPISHTVSLKVKPQSEEVRRSFESRHVEIHERTARVSLYFRPARILYQEPDNTVTQSDCLLIENLLDSPDRELSPLEVRGLYVDFRQRHPALKPGSAEFSIALRDDPFFNALQVKYGYALTCHKAQGGEWETAIIDFSGGGGTRNEMFFRWAYTAITRARTRLVTVDAPRYTASSDMAWQGLAAEDASPDANAAAASHADPD